MQQKPRVLYVEDDANLASVYKMRLEAEGLEVRHCENGEQALQSAIEYKPDLVLLDIMLPRVDGFNVLDIMKNTKEIASSKIIVLSALGQPSDIEKAKSLQADEYLIKSDVGINEVIARVKFHLGLAQ
jgi:two-component system, OmpR family, response regulator ResD